MDTISVDYLLILGCRVKGEAAEPTLQMRIQCAANYLTKHQQIRVIACGGIVHDDQAVSEAAVIKRELVLLGIDAERIILEDKSRTTVENFINAAKLIACDEASVAFLTSNFHIRRAGIIARRCGFKNIACVSAPSPKKQLLKNRLREIIAFPGVLFIGDKV